MSATAVFRNGRVFTVDDKFTIAESLAIRDNTIVAVGSDLEVSKWIGPSTKITDLQGRSLLPGINDSHLHALIMGVTSPPQSVNVGFPSVKSIADIRSIVASEVKKKNPGEWIIGSGWFEDNLEECNEKSGTKGRLPHRDDIDEVSPNNPVFLQDFSFHRSWVNSAALAVAGINDLDISSHGGNVLKDDKGKLTGVFCEGAQSLVQGYLPAVNEDLRERSIKAAVSRIQAFGITSLTDPALGPGGEKMGGRAAGTAAIHTYARLARSGTLGVRVNALYLPAPQSGATPEEYAQHVEAATLSPPDVDPRHFRVIGMKVFADGIPTAHTAWMHTAYTNAPTCGSLCIGGSSHDQRVENLDKIIKIGHDLGHQLGIHVTGDKAIDAVVDALVAAQKANPRPDPRHYLIHGNLVYEPTLKKMAAHGIGVNFNPGIKWEVADGEAEVIGDERAEYEFPYASALRAGVKVMSSSDAPVVPPDWRQGVATMMLRQGRSTGIVSGKDECVGLEAALRTYTINGAWQDFAESWKGSLEVGKVADLCVVGADLMAVSPQEIPNVPIDVTILDGKTVYSRV
ncbi:putative lipo protein [Aaosphaeria arxii CBS 175.79]|uniref:Putative lipo protein n=1 Tax=Aaosphaeria arxii CBS 175.79 TaxID=1450172 RepID=A0A6A5X9L6_9PLEO|nr:putative lipo protein [Aaosphaeria arxii CBS 175.79]KAF2009651.1 putative lipo protein [Aaosphaeria arxii CBS 175.79]